MKFLYIIHPSNLIIIIQEFSFHIIAQNDPFKLVPEESKLDDVNSEGNHKTPIKGR